MKYIFFYSLLIVSLFASAKGKKDDKSQHEGKHHGIEKHDQWIVVKQANDQVKHRSYYNAIGNYKTVLDSLPDNEYLNHQLGMAYFKARDYKNAAIYLSKIYALKETNYPYGNFYYGETLKMLGEYELAKDAFKKFYRYKSRDLEVKRYRKIARNEVASCNYALAVIEEDTTFRNVTFQEGDINYSYTDFSPIPLSKNKMMYASLREDTVVSYEYGDNVFFPVKLYTAEKTGENTWDKAQEVEKVNSPYDHTANGAFNSDSSRFFFSRCRQNPDNEIICAIYFQEKTDNGWSKPHKAHSKVNMHAYTSTQPTLGTYRKRKRRKMYEYDVLYFVSDRPGGRGGYDIWYSLIDEDGKFSKPENCKRINTIRDEVTPRYVNEETTMYFSSNYHYGLGGYDIFSSYGRLTRWRKPENLKIPTNSSYDDTYYVPYEMDSDTLQEGFIVSNRPGGIALTSETCCDDIYAFAEYIPVYDTLMGTVQEKLITQILHDSNFVALKDTNQVLADSVQLQQEKEELKGLLADVQVGIIKERRYQKAITEERIDQIEAYEEDVEWQDSTSTEGDFKLHVIQGKQYRVVLKKEGYEPKVVTMEELQKDPTIALHHFEVDSSHLAQEQSIVLEERKSLSLSLEKEDIKKDEKFVLDHVYFDSNMDDFKPSSIPALKLLYNFLKKHSDVKIEISGHTDSKGGDEYNMDLSKRRAESVMDFLISKGIEENRLTFTGYGESQPIAKNQNEDGSWNYKGMSKNRRTEVKILRN